MRRMCLEGNVEKQILEVTVGERSVQIEKKQNQTNRDSKESECLTVTHDD